MVSSTKLALFAFLRSVRSTGLGRNLRAFILRCLLLWPRTLRRFLRKIWPWHSQTGSKDEKKTNGDTGGPSSTGMLRMREEYVVVCASRDLGGGGEPSRLARLGSGEAERPIPPEHVSPRTPSVHSRSSSHSPSPQGSPMLSATRPPLGSPRSSASSLPGSIHDAMEFFINRSDTPVTPADWTHSHAAGGQFTSRSRNRSRQSSPLRRHLSRPGTPATHDIERPLAPIRHSQDSLEGSGSEVSIRVRPASPEDTQTMHSTYRARLPSIDVRAESFPTRHQSPSTESVNSSAVSSRSGSHSFWVTRANIGASQGGGSIQDSMTSPSTQDPRIRFPVPLAPPISTPIPTANDPNSPHQPCIPSIGLMTSEQVSRYSKKGDVYVSSVVLANIYCDIRSGHGRRASLY